MPTPFASLTSVVTVSTLFLAGGCPSPRPRAPTVDSTGAGSSSGWITNASAFPDGAAIHMTPELVQLTSEEQKTLSAALRGAPRMSVFLPSSCHDRAHALWLLLPPTVQVKMAKTWILSESAYTSVLRGGLLLREKSMREPWRYHVALVFRDVEGGISVLDPARDDWPAPVSLSAWVGSLKPSPDALLPAVSITMDAKLYLFYGHATNAAANNTGAMSNGNFFTYSHADLARQQDWIPRSLARDDVAVSGDAARCADLANVMDDADKLQTVLNCVRADDDVMCTSRDDATMQSVANIRDHCTSVVKLYRERLVYWKKLMP